MAQPFSNATITNSGLELINRSQLGECVIEFTRIAVGDGIYTKAEKNREMLAKMTELKNERKSYSIYVKEKVDEIDPTAFVIVTDAREVHGEGFIEKK